MGVWDTTSFDLLFYQPKTNFFDEEPMSIYKAEKPSVCLSDTLITHLGLQSSTYHLLNIINPSSSSFKFVTVSECDNHITFCSWLETKKWRKIKQHSIENHSMAQWVEQLTCI